MNILRSLVLTLAGIAFTLMAFLFAASLGLALAGIVSVLIIASAIQARFAPKPVRAPINRNGQRRLREPRVWNDGRGTIIDL